MNATASQKTKIGLFVIASILVLVAGVFLIGSKKNMFSSTYSVWGNFKNTGGLQEGNIIRFGGVNVGTVKTIRILTDTIIRVDMVIQTDKREFIKNDVVATVGSDGLMGDKILTILPGSPKAPLLASGSQMRTAEPTDFGAIINKFTTVANNAEIITGALADMSMQIKNGDGSISRLLYRNDLAMGLEGTMNNAKSITGSLQDIATQIKSGKGSIGSLLYTDSLSNGVNRAVSSANSALVTVQRAADNFSENMAALQGNYFLKGYFKKKAKARADSAKQDFEEEAPMDDEELGLIRLNAEKELERRRQSRLAHPAKNG